ncbi:membrane protein insertase YidC [Hahella ganghwensis]|uniref:membrane protein insertase YidC n=1 Tax=Hahella ganghwensis TaxID=286420 RepID=UPI00036E0262|nr:membrane protein insertase YidC [Hahella ganghwensis]
MDYIRTPLIIGLLVVSYLLVLEWNKDFSSDQGPAVTQTAPGFDETSSSSVPSDHSTTGELATPESMSSEQNVEVSASSRSSSTGGEVTVLTDVLAAKIDLTGGNLTYSALKDYPVSLNNPAPLEIFQKNSERYFVAESGLIGRDGFDASKNGPLPVYQSSQNHYKLSEDNNELTVDLNYTRDGVNVTKRYVFSRGNYEIKVYYLVNNDSVDPWRANFSAKLVRDNSPDPTKAAGMGAVSYLGAVVSTTETPYEKVDFDDMDEGSVQVEDNSGWVAFVQHYFVSAWIPRNEETHTYQTRVRNGLYLMGYVDPEVTVAPGTTETFEASLYVGPKILESLQSIAPNLDLTIDFGWLWLIAKPLFLVLDYIHDYVGNWGIAIILLTVLIKAIFFHLSAASYRSMANMRRVTPELQRIREQYSDDRQKMSQAMMELYKKEKINPLGGCLPILVQMPVFIALYWVLLESVELRQAPFFFWIQDLSIMDPYFILPLLMGATMFLQMHLNPTPPDPIQARVMKMMPIVFTVFFLWFPAGLVLYWLVNNCLSIAQQWVITRKIEKDGLKAK